MDPERIRKVQERENLRNVITQWNANRLDLFELSEPNEDLEFHGVMRFYFQDAGQKVATKCIRVSSTATAKVVIKTLIEKFRPDMRMLSIPEYALYEIHENGEERKLGEEEKPLLVQLNWHKDDREGRFLLRRMNEKTYLLPQNFDDDTNFKRKLSKREKKEKKKKEKLQRLKSHGNEENKNADGIAEKLYTELPETSFTRSISNPEAVMRRRRQQKLEKKLQQFRSKDGGPDTGGTLKIYGESLCRDVPYKTLLLSVRDNAAHVVKEMLDKYGLDKEDPVNYCLVQSYVTGDGDNKEYHGSNSMKEYILDDDECPLAILMNYSPAKGSIMFQIRRRPSDFQPRKRKKKPKSVREDFRYEDGLPFLVELNPDSSEMSPGAPHKHCLHLNVTEVGSERATITSGQYLQLFGPNVQPRHCVIAHTEGIVTVTPCSRDAETYVNDQRIYETTILQHGMLVRFGKIHNYRFIDPSQDKRRLRHESGPRQSVEYFDRHSTKDDSSLHLSAFETTLDAADNNNNPETLSTSSQKEDRRSDKSKEGRPPGSERYDHRRGHDPILPAVLEFREDGEDAFLRAIITNVDTNLVQFKLAPTYSLYMAARYRASTQYRPDTSPNERAHRLTDILNKVATMIQHIIQEKYNDASSLAFWMANASELLHFLKQDRHISAYSIDAQDLLAECVQVAFRSLVQCLQFELQNAMPACLDDREEVTEDDVNSATIMGIFSSAMSLLRRCRVNAALTIQLFSQLFHYINMWLFNKFVCDDRVNLCTRLWGIRLKRRLARVELWAEKQGLELAADCHLSRISQAAHLLQSPKSSPDDIATISSTCFKLNSLQLRALLERYQPASDEPHIPQELIENVVKVAENTADELARTDGREVKLEEDPDLQLPFLLPEDGYSCDIVRGVPAGLQEFLYPLHQAGLCRMTVQPTSSGYWTIYMSDQDIIRGGIRSSSSLGHHGGEPLGKEPEIVTIKLQKSNNGMGLSIVAAKGVGQDRLGIYIKSVVKGGAADADSRLQAGDQLLKVDGQSLVGITQEKAAEYMTRTGPVVTLEVAKQGAIYHGLATLLSQPSPLMQRGLGSSSARRLSERDLPSRILRDQNQELDPQQMPRMQSSKSVPSLNSGAPVQEPVRVPSTGNLKTPHEVFNPGYSRTSSTTSIVKASDHPSNKDNLQKADLYEGQHSRPASHTNAQIQEERYYQNISLYQEQQQTPVSPKSQVHRDGYSHQTVSAIQYEGQYNGHLPPPNQPLLYKYQPEGHQQPKGPQEISYDERIHRSQRGSQSSLHRPDQNAGRLDRPHSTLVSQKEREQYASMGQIDERQTPYSPRNEHTNRLHDGRSPVDYKGSTTNGRYPEGFAVEDTHGFDFRGRPPHHPRSTELSPERGNSDPRKPTERDFIRQEAKMEEMREEVRRREERGHRSQWNGVHPPPPQRPNWTHNKPVPNTYPPSSQGQHHHPNQPYLPKAPPPAPKPKPYVQGPEKPQRQFTHDIGQNNNNEIPPERPPLPDEAHLYQDSPPPPPPPPTSTHPLVQLRALQNGPPPPYRHSQSGYMDPRHFDHYGQPRPHLPADMRASIRPAHPSNQSRVTFDPRVQESSGKSFTYTLEVSSAMSPSPWEREEREKEQKRRLTEARRLRDQEIQELEALQFRTPKQEERLRTLRLEQEFQRRADELKNNEDEDENEDDDDINERRGLLRMVQEDLERNRMRRLERERENERREEILQQQQQQETHPDRLDENQRNTSVRPDYNSIHNPEEWLRRQQEIRNQRKEQKEEEDRIRQQKIEEVRRKKEQERLALRELQATKEAEERLLREAQRRQEEDLKTQRALQQQRALQNQVTQNRPNYTSYPHQYNSYVAHSVPSNGAAQRLDNLLMNPPTTIAYSRPGESVPNLQGNSQLYSDSKPAHESNIPPSSNSALRNSSNHRTEAVPQKRVSFHDTKIESHVTYDDNTSNGETRDNRDSPAASHTAIMTDNLRSTEDCSLLATPHNSQQLNNFTVGMSPGVIGAQEIYKDPRKKIEAQRQTQNNKVPGPEKLSFREKMKMFALETGEPESPRDKVKISKAQREIETNLNGS